MQANLLRAVLAWMGVAMPKGGRLRGRGKGQEGVSYGFKVLGTTWQVSHEVVVYVFANGSAKRSVGAGVASIRGND